MSLLYRRISPRLRRLLPLLVVATGLLAGCESGSQEEGVAGPVAPAPSNYRDFESADRLSAYLRSDALPLVGAHRGGATEQFPENALPTFAHSLTHGPVLLEVDVRMTKDSVLVLMHDETLERTTSGQGAVQAQTLRALRALRLTADTGRTTTRFAVPTLAEALAWAEGRAVLQLDVKENVPRSTVANLLRRREALDQALVITYTLEEARWYHGRLPDLLLSVSAETAEEARGYLDQIDPSRLVAFAGVGRPSEAVLRVFSGRDVPVTVGTFGDLDRQARQRGLVVYRDLFRQGVDIIATNETALASQAAATYRPEPSAKERP
jgi:glycerophosphoryl diester phosphodiesterase